MKNDITGDGFENAKCVDSYTESLCRILSIIKQIKLPGDFVAKRLESVTPEQIHSELSALLSTAQTRGSALLHILFASSPHHNENLEEIFELVLPFREKLLGSIKSLQATNEYSLEMKNTSKMLLFRYKMVSYAKLTLSTLVEAYRHLDSIYEDIIESLGTCNGGYDRFEANISKFDRNIQTIEKITSNASRIGSLLSSCDAQYDVCTNWSLFEIVPKELTHVKTLLRKCRRYECKLNEMIHTILDDRDEKDRWPFGISDEDTSPIELVLEIESLLGKDELEEFRKEYSIDFLEQNIERLCRSLMILIETYAKGAFTHLYALYKERSSLDELSHISGDSEQFEIRLKEKLSVYLSGLGYIIRGFDGLQMVMETECSGNPLIDLFSSIFLKPLFDSVFSHLSPVDRLHDGSTSPRQEFHDFSEFVESVEKKILNPSKNFVMKFLNDITYFCGTDSFKLPCVFDAIAGAIINHIEDNFPSIYFPIYPEYFLKNYRAFESLIDIIENSFGIGSEHFLKWRGSKVPHDFSVRFSTEVVCEKFVEHICSSVINEVSRYHEIDGNFFFVADKRFYISSSSTIYEKIKQLFAEDNFFYHLFPKYLRGVREIFSVYITHIKSFITHIESMRDDRNKEDIRVDGGWPSGLSFSYAAYVLHDVDSIEKCLRTGSIRSCSPNVDVLNTGTDDPCYDCERVGTLKLRDEEFGDFTKMILKKIEYPLSVCIDKLRAREMQCTLSNGNVCNGVTPTENHKIISSLWERCLQLNSKSEFEEYQVELGGYLNGLEDLERLLLFTIVGMESVCDFLSAIYDQIQFLKNELENYIVKSLYSTSSCGLQFIQSMPSKFRVANKSTQNQIGVSGYTKFLVVPLISFKEFAEPILPGALLRDLMLRTITRLSEEYLIQIKNLVETVKNVNASLMKTKKISNNELSGEFLVADLEMIKVQLSKDVKEFGEQCQKRLNVNPRDCGALKELMQHVSNKSAD